MPMLNEGSGKAMAFPVTARNSSRFAFFCSHWTGAGEHGQAKKLAQGVRPRRRGAGNAQRIG
jgi:hypothetical protein